MAVAEGPAAQATGRIRQTSSVLTGRDRWDHALARWGVNRGGHLVPPGLYALGRPGRGARVFVTANYTLSFDALRKALAGLDSYILVLDTKGINVWCAAGKGTFGTDELVRRVASTGLADVVDHRRLIVPQLGATGVAAHEVRARSGFDVEYGPVRADDIRDYLANESATEEMRRVRFGLVDRLLLVPVELVHASFPLAVVALALYLAAGAGAAWAGAVSILAGAVAFPIAIPWIPGSDFTVKGLVLGVAAAAPFAAGRIAGSGGPWWWGAGWAAVHVLGMAPGTAFLALLFTGSTTHTSRSGVELEIRRYTRPIALMFAAGALLAASLVLARVASGATW